MMVNVTFRTNPDVSRDQTVADDRGRHNENTDRWRQIESPVSSKTLIHIACTLET